MPNERKEIDKFCDHMRELYAEYQNSLSNEFDADARIKYQAKIDLLHHLLNEVYGIKRRKSD